VLIPLLLVLITVMVYRSGRIGIEVRLLITVITIVLTCFFGWLLATQKREKKNNRITRITVDDKDLHYYRSQYFRLIQN